MLKKANMQASVEQLANDLQGVLDGFVTTGEFRTRHPIAGETGPLEIILCLVEHYLDDADIRHRDAAYGATQDAEMQKLISALRSGRLSDATEIHFLGRSI